MFAYVLVPVKVSGGPVTLQSDQNNSLVALPKSTVELAKRRHKMQEEVTEWHMLRLPWLI